MSGKVRSSLKEPARKYVKQITNRDKQNQQLKMQVLTYFIYIVSCWLSEKKIEQYFNFSSYLSVLGFINFHHHQSRELEGNTT